MFGCVCVYVGEVVVVVGLMVMLVVMIVGVVVVGGGLVVMVGIMVVMLEGVGGIFHLLVYGASVGGGTLSPFRNDDGRDLSEQKCTCVTILTQVPSIPAPSPLRCRLYLNRCGFSLNAMNTSRKLNPLS